MSESSTKPYLLRALHEWCTDNGYTPHVVVAVDANTVVPVAHIRDGQITLNIGTLATNRLTLGNDYIEFQARFSGVTEHIFVPVAAVSAIYARETGAGMGFDVVESQPYPDGETPESAAGNAATAGSIQAVDGVDTAGQDKAKGKDKGKSKGKTPKASNPPDKSRAAKADNAKADDTKTGNSKANSPKHTPKPPRLTIVK